LGDLTLQCIRDYCKRRRRWRTPADTALGMNDTAGRWRTDKPTRSGPVEAAYRQAQCRFKQPGQCWSTAGDEVLLCLETFWRNHRRALLFPRATFNPAIKIKMRPRTFLPPPPHSCILLEFKGK
jgi:hypothetical protein